MGTAPGDGRPAHRRVSRSRRRQPVAPVVDRGRPAVRLAPVSLRGLRVGFQDRYARSTRPADPVVVRIVVVKLARHVISVLISLMLRFATVVVVQVAPQAVPILLIVPESIRRRIVWSGRAMKGLKATLKYSNMTSRTAVCSLLGTGQLGSSEHWWTAPSFPCENRSEDMSIMHRLIAELLQRGRLGVGGEW